MVYLFTLLFLAFITLLIIGLIKPAIGLFWYKKIPTRGKVIIFYGLGVFVCSIGIGMSAPPVESKLPKNNDKVLKNDGNNGNQGINHDDSIKLIIEKDSSFIEKEVKINGTTLQVVLSSKTKHLSINGNYYLNILNLSNMGISRVQMYIYNPSKSLANGTYSDPVSDELSDLALTNIKDDWVKSYMSNWDGSCRPLESYIKKNMNDPDSYQHIETSYRFYQNKNSFLVLTSFRGNNAFGAKVINNAKAFVSLDGEVVSFDLN